MNFDTYEYTVPVHYLSYLINADATGLTDDEFETIKAFEERLPGAGHWVFPDDIDGETDFTKWNDVDDLAADCVELEFMARL